MPLRRVDIKGALAKAALRQVILSDPARALQIERAIMAKLIADEETDAATGPAIEPGRFTFVSWAAIGRAQRARVWWERGATEAFVWSISIEDEDVFDDI